MNLYSFLRSIVKLPRPNEIWGEKVSNIWNPLTVYLYLKLCWTQFTTHFGIIIQLFNMTVAIGTLLVVTHTVNYGYVIGVGIIGIIFAFWAGHIVIVKNIMKLEASMSNNQSPELMSILSSVTKIEKRTEEILDKLDK